jgi:hypothetical protein
MGVYIKYTIYSYLYMVSEIKWKIPLSWPKFHPLLKGIYPILLEVSQDNAFRRLHSVQFLRYPWSWCGNTRVSFRCSFLCIIRVPCDAILMYLPFRAFLPPIMHVGQLRLGAPSLLSTLVLFSKPTHPSPGVGRVERLGWGSSSLIPIVSSPWVQTNFPSPSRLVFTHHSTTTSPLVYIFIYICRHDDNTREWLHTFIVCKRW